jgi:hypothetical protein
MPSPAQPRRTRRESADIRPRGHRDGSDGHGTNDQALSALLALRDIYRMADALGRSGRGALEHREAADGAHRVKNASR